MLAAAGYTVVYKGKWHLSHPLAGGHSWSWADSERIARDYGFGGWEPPDSGENAKAEHFGGGTAGPLAEGFDEFYTRQAEAFLERHDLPEPFCLVVSLVNPHDVLGYPASYETGGYRRADFADLGVQLPPTAGERLENKPAVHALMRLGQTSYIGGIRGRRQQLDYVNFYAYLHRLVDEKLGRIVGALGDAGDPSSLRSRTVVARISDHGELGLSHGGLRQKMFNAYEETLRVPFTISNPLLFPGPRETDAPTTLADLVPTLLDLCGVEAPRTLDGFSRAAIVASHARPGREEHAALPATLARLLDDPPRDLAPEHTLFTYDDHQAGTASQDAPGQPNRVRAVRDSRHTYAVYLDPSGRAAPEYELYDREADPHQVENLVDVRAGRGRTARVERARRELHDQLAASCERVGALAPACTPRPVP
jgi:arylsulfatase A-like enzyme